MVDEIGQGIHWDVGISHEDIHLAQLVHLGGQPFGGDVLGGKHIRHATDHLAIAVVDAQETRACARSSVIAETDVEVCLTATLGRETPEVVAAEHGQEDDLVAQQGEVMGDVTPHPTGGQAHRARVGVARHESLETGCDDIGIGSTYHTNSHNVSFFIRFFFSASACIVRTLHASGKNTRRKYHNPNPY